MGSGGMIVMDEDDCVIDVAKFYMEFCLDESCGKCSPCRIGTRQLYTLLEKISDGRGELDDLQKLKDIGFAMQQGSLCALGQSAPNPILSTIAKFEQEYINHIVNKNALLVKCKNLLPMKSLTSVLDVVFVLENALLDVLPESEKKNTLLIKLNVLNVVNALTPVSLMQLL